MYKKIAVAIVLCIHMFVTSTAFAVPLKVRQAGIVDHLQDSGNVFSHQQISYRDGAAATEIPAYITYKMFRNIEQVIISVSNGGIDESFKVYSSANGKTYQQIDKTSSTGEFEHEGIKQALYQFSNMGQEQKYLKIEILNKEVRIRKVFVNRDLYDIGFGEIFGSADSGSVGSSSDRVVTQEELQIYRARMVESLRATNDVSALASSIESDGSWANIVYNRDSTSTAYVHCERIEAIARSVGTPESPYYKNQDIMAKLLLAIDYWIEQDIVWPHWYNNRIRIPKAFANVLLIAGEILPAATRAKAEKYLLGKVQEIESTNQFVGSNAAEVQMSRVRYALYMNDLDRLKAALDRIAQEVIVVNKLGPGNDWRKRLWANYVQNHAHLPDTIEGIQVDYSVLFHGPLIYSGGYGLGFIREISDLLWETRDTNLFPKDGLVDLIDHILEHYVYIVRGTTMDYSTSGRMIATTGVHASSKNGADLYSMVDKLSKINNVPRREELAAIAASLSEDSDSKVLDMGQYKNVSAVASVEMDDQGLAQNVVDSSFDTRWAAPDDGAFIIADLGEVKPVGAVAIAFHMGAARRTKIELEISEDNKSWKNVYKGETSGLTEGLECYVFAPRNARYFKIVGHGNTVNEWTNIIEMVIFDKVDVVKPAHPMINFVAIDEISGLKRYRISREAEVPVPVVTGNKYYWKADYAANPKENFLLTVRTSSNRTIGSEAVNTYNLKGDFLGDGCTYIYRTGKEYEDIFGAWDWTKIPGTTTRTRAFDPLMIQHNDLIGSASDFAGGVSDGINGASAMELVREGLSAKKSWFMFDNEFVALGADIKNTTNVQHITTLNQALLNGAITTGKTGAAAKVLAKGSHPGESVHWVLHDKIGYLFSEDTNVSIDNQMVEADRIDIHYGGALSRPNRTQMVQKEIFALWLDHSKEKTNTYEYTVIPGISEDGLKEYVENNPIYVISNDGKVQAVEHTGLNLAQAVFWTAGSITLQNGMKITVDGQVLIQARIQDEKLIFSIASLHAKDDMVNVEISKGLRGNGAEEAEGTTKFQVKLPGGDYAGQSVVLNFDIL